MLLKVFYKLITCSTVGYKNDERKLKKNYRKIKKTLHLQSRNGRWYHSSVGRAKD